MGSKKDKKKKLKQRKSEPETEKKPTTARPKKGEDIEDIDAILHELALEQQAKFKVTEENQCEPPCRRANCSLTSNPLDSELFLYGGESFDGQKVTVYNDFYKFHTERREWKKITSPNNPGPRASHQVVIFPNGMLYLWGGEFVSPNESNFFHYKDFWCMDLKLGFQWELINIKCPPPRSGHRMVVWKHFIIMFGGFYDQTHETKYYDDLWVFDSMNLKWSKIDIPVNELRPSPRSGFSMIVHGDNLLIYGGYSKIVKGKTSKGQQHIDAWSMRLNTEFVHLKWEKKRKVGGISPGQRSGCSMVYFKGKGVFFGGVAGILDTKIDIEEDSENIASVVFDDMYQYIVDSNKMYPLNLKSPKKSKKERLRALENNDESSKEDDAPGPRLNTALCVNKNTLYLFGGIYEIDSKEFTLGDFWCINLDKMLVWDLLHRDEVDFGEWNGEDSDNEDQSDRESDDDSDNSKDSDIDEDERRTNELLNSLSKNDPSPGGIIVLMKKA